MVPALLPVDVSHRVEPIEIASAQQIAVCANLEVDDVAAVPNQIAVTAFGPKVGERLQVVLAQQSDDGGAAAPQVLPQQPPAKDQPGRNDRSNCGGNRAHPRRIRCLGPGPGVRRVRTKDVCHRHRA